jgi:hypothetical protein
MTRDELEHIWSWANENLAAEKESPAAWEQYIRICEVLDLISSKLSPAMLKANSSSQRRGHITLVVDNAACSRPSIRV